MLAYVIIPAMAAAGYAGAPAWIVLLGIAGVASEGWWDKLQRLRQQPRQPWSTKTTAYFISGIVGNLTLSLLAYLAGHILRAAVG